MNPNIEKLYQTAQKRKRLILGLMSGTSLDGLDLALCEFEGSGTQTRFRVLEFDTIPYTSLFQDQIRKVFAKEWVEQKHISGLHVLIARTHAQFVLESLKKWGYETDQIDAIASHGQTIFHAPYSSSEKIYPNNTFQIGDGDHIACETGIITLSDFRQKHVAAGGEGAPLVLYGDFLLFSDSQVNRVLLNLGGISNFTYLPSETSRNKGKQIWASDLGPANTLINQFVKKEYGVEMDRDGAISKQGVIQEDLLRELLNTPFFSLPFPKTTGPELFNLDYLNEAIERTNGQFEKEDIVATLTAFTVEALTLGFKEIECAEIYVSGGGLHNPEIMKGIKNNNPHLKFKNFETLGILPDAKEAVLFAVLANETLCGNKNSLKPLKNVPQVTFGKISFPD